MSLSSRLCQGRWISCVARAFHGRCLYIGERGRSVRRTALCMSELASVLLWMTTHSVAHVADVQFFFSCKFFMVFIQMEIRVGPCFKKKNCGKNTMTCQLRIAQTRLLRWMTCMLREIHLVGCSYLDIIDYRFLFLCEHILKSSCQGKRC